MENAQINRTVFACLKGGFQLRQKGVRRPFNSQDILLGNPVQVHFPDGLFELEKLGQGIPVFMKSRHLVEIHNGSHTTL